MRFSISRRWVRGSSRSDSLRRAAASGPLSEASLPNSAMSGPRLQPSVPYGTSMAASPAGPFAVLASSCAALGKVQVGAPGSRSASWTVTTV